jgi:hypothetical protein
MARDHYSTIAILLKPLVSYCTLTLKDGVSEHRVGRVLAFSPVVGIGTPPTPLPQASVPFPFDSGGRGTLAGERKGRRVPIPTRGHTLWYFVTENYSGRRRLSYH